MTNTESYHVELALPAVSEGQHFGTARALLTLRARESTHEPCSDHTERYSQSRGPKQFRARETAPKERRTCAAGVRNNHAASERIGPESLPGQLQNAQPDSGGYHLSSRPVQEASLAGRRTDLLPAPSPFRQALRGA